MWGEGCIDGVYLSASWRISVCMHLCLATISSNILIIPFTFFPSLSFLSHYLLNLFCSLFDLTIHYCPISCLPPHPLSLPSLSTPASSGGCPCGRGGLHCEGHPEHPVPVERGVPGPHLPSRHNTVWGHQGRRGSRSGQGGPGDGRCPQREAPAEDGKWSEIMNSVFLRPETRL